MGPIQLSKRDSCAEFIASPFSLKGQLRERYSWVVARITQEELSSAQVAAYDRATNP